MSRGLVEENISVFRILKSRFFAPENPLFTSRSEFLLLASKQKLYTNSRPPLLKP